MDAKEDRVFIEAARITSGERRATYGHPVENHERIAVMWTVLFGPVLKDGEVITARQVALAMILLKMAREVHAPKFDNLVDLAGYVKMVDMIDQHAEG